MVSKLFQVNRHWKNTVPNTKGLRCFCSIPARKAKKKKITERRGTVTGVLVQVEKNSFWVEHRIASCCWLMRVWLLKALANGRLWSSLLYVGASFCLKLYMLSDTVPVEVHNHPIQSIKSLYAVSGLLKENLSAWQGIENFLQPWRNSCPCPQVSWKSYRRGKDLPSCVCVLEE